MACYLRAAVLRNALVAISSGLKKTSNNKNLETRIF